MVKQQDPLLASAAKPSAPVPYQAHQAGRAVDLCFGLLGCRTALLLECRQWRGLCCLPVVAEPDCIGGFERLV